MKPHWQVIAVIALGGLSVVLASALGGLLILSHVRQKTPEQAASPDTTAEHTERLLNSIKQNPSLDLELHQAADGAFRRLPHLTHSLPPVDVDLFDDAVMAFMCVSVNESKGDANDLMRSWIRHFHGK